MPAMSTRVQLHAEAARGAGSHHQGSAKGPPRCAGACTYQAAGVQLAGRTAAAAHWCHCQCGTLQGGQGARTGSEAAHLLPAGCACRPCKGRLAGSLWPGACPQRRVQARLRLGTQRARACSTGHAHQSQVGSRGCTIAQHSLRGRVGACLLCIASRRPAAG